MLILEKHKTGKRIPYGNVITKLIQNGEAAVESASLSPKYYDSTYFIQRHFRWNGDTWSDLRKRGEDSVPDEPEGGDGECDGSTQAPYIKKTIWRRINEYFGCLFKKVDKLQSSVDKLQKDMDMVKRASGIPMEAKQDEEDSLEEDLAPSEKEEEAIDEDESSGDEQSSDGEGDDVGDSSEGEE